jgi:lipoprotein NlpI
MFALLPILAVTLAQSPAELLRTGVDHFEAGKIEESVKDFDRLVALRPSVKPELWQRGIALYYAGRYNECREQFALHRTVNSDDVENAAWHYLCTAKASSPVKAREELIPVEEDYRSPMLKLHAFYAGRATQDEVIKEALSHSSRFFAYLYIGLYWEANGDPVKARSWLKKAAQASEGQDYMGTVARVHWNRLYAKK